MKHQPIQKGLFTFYKEQAELQDGIDLHYSPYNNVHQTSIKQSMKSKNFINTFVRTIRNKDNQESSMACIFKRKIKQENKDKCIEQYKDSNLVTKILEKNRSNRNQNLLKIFLKKSQRVQSKSQQLKTHLQDMLKSDFRYAKQIENYDGNQVTPCELVTTSIKLNQSFSIGKIKSKEKILLLNQPKNENKNFKIMISTKNLEELKQEYTEKLPNIDKSFHFQKLKGRKKIDSANHQTRYPQINGKCEESTDLKPLKTERLQSKISNALKGQPFSMCEYSLVNDKHLAKQNPEIKLMTNDKQKKFWQNLLLVLSLNEKQP